MIEPSRKDSTSKKKDFICFIICLRLVTFHVYSNYSLYLVKLNNHLLLRQ